MAIFSHYLLVLRYAAADRRPTEPSSRLLHIMTMNMALTTAKMTRFLRNLSVSVSMDDWILGNVY